MLHGILHVFIGEDTAKRTHDFSREDIRSLFIVSDAMDARQGATVRPAAWLEEEA